MRLPAVVVHQPTYVFRSSAQITAVQYLYVKAFCRQSRRKRRHGRIAQESLINGESNMNWRTLIWHVFGCESRFSRRYTVCSKPLACDKYQSANTPCDGVSMPESINGHHCFPSNGVNCFTLDNSADSDRRGLALRRDIEADEAAASRYGIVRDDVDVAVRVEAIAVHGWEQS